MVVNIYLNFNGQTEEAFIFYKGVFGGEFDGEIQRFKDLEGMAGMGEVLAEHREMIVRIGLKIGDNVRLLGTDAPEGMGFKLEFGNHIHISIEPESRAKAETIFKQLAEGGKITMALQEMFWGDYYGSCTDKFGVQWMVNCKAKL